MGRGAEASRPCGLFLGMRRRDEMGGERGLGVGVWAGRGRMGCSVERFKGIRGRSAVRVPAAYARPDDF